MAACEVAMWCDKIRRLFSEAGQVVQPIGFAHAFVEQYDGVYPAEEQELGQDDAILHGPRDSRRSGRNLAAALLIDSPSVLGPLPDPCSSPTFRKLSDPSMHSHLHQDALQRASGSASVNLLRRLSSSRSKGTAPSAPSLTAGSLRSYSSGMVPVLDSVSSMADDAELVSGAAAADSSSTPVQLPPRARALLKRAAISYAGAFPHAPASR
jgi:hypothetical protein